MGAKNNKNAERKIKNGKFYVGLKRKKAGRPK